MSVRRGTALLALVVVAVCASPAAANRQRIASGPAVPVPYAAVIHAPCPGGRSGACSDPAAGIVYLPRGTSRFIRYHELGHVYLERLSPFWKGAIMTHMGLDPARIAWVSDDYVCDQFHGEVCPNELAADAYAACAMGFVPGRGRWMSTYDYFPSRRQQRKVCGAIRRSDITP